jgi:hypothetical protein
VVSRSDIASATIDPPPNQHLGIESQTRPYINDFLVPDLDSRQDDSGITPLCRSRGDRIGKRFQKELGAIAVERHADQGREMTRLFAGQRARPSRVGIIFVHVRNLFCIGQQVVGISNPIFIRSVLAS